MNTKTLTKEEVRDALKKVMYFETDELLQEATKILCEGKSVLVDGLTYLGNGQHTRRTNKKRYKYKMIVPIVDSQGSLYSTDLFEGNVKNAITGKYGVYIVTRQLCIDVVGGIDTDYDIERFDFGYKDDKYGRFKVEVLEANKE